MAETTQLELVTPARIMAQQAVEMVVAPGVEGLFGVLPRHAPLLADLTRGVVQLHQNGKVIDRFMIDGGLADVSSESVTILAITWIQERIGLIQGRKIIFLPSLCRTYPQVFAPLHPHIVGLKIQLN